MTKSKEPLAEGEVRPITASERNALLRIAKERFALLEADISLEAIKARSEIEAEIRAKYSDQINEFREKATTISDATVELNRRINDLYLWAHISGLTVHYHNTVSWNPPIVSPRELTTAISAVDERVRIKLNELRNDLKRQHLAVEEKILMAGIDSATVKELLDGIPTADKLVSIGSFMRLEVAALSSGKEAVE